MEQSKLLNTKKAIIRYVSHELLTPLNAAALGLKLVSDYTRIVDDEDVYQTVMDINKSIASAVELLESLSCYEKIDSGIIKLHKQENVSVISFMEDSDLSYLLSLLGIVVEIVKVSKSINIYTYNNICCFCAVNVVSMRSLATNFF